MKIWAWLVYVEKRPIFPPLNQNFAPKNLSRVKTMELSFSSCLVVIFFFFFVFRIPDSAIGVRVGGGFLVDQGVDSLLEDAYIAIQKWKSAITDDPLGILQTWVGPNVCAYKGIFCADSQNGVVVAAIDLNKALLRGILVEQLSMLSTLSMIHLNSNRFSGPIPESFKDLAFLQELDLSNNMFSGSFPTSTLLIPNLIFLDLRFNQFTGPIPEDIFNKRLDAILLNNNNFQGPVPSTLGNSLASVINLANNNLTGEIPNSFGLMNGSALTSRLKEIMLLNNSLTGCVPQGIGILTQVEVLDFSFNSLIGQLPEVSCMNEVQVLNFGHNKLCGEVPDSICELKKLVNLTLSYNFLSGFDEDCGGRLLDKGFDLSVNCIPGRVMQRSGQQCSVVHGGETSCMRRTSSQGQPTICASVITP